MLNVEDLEAWYGHSYILQKINLHVHASEVVSVIGRNGAGKTTTLRALMGLVAKRHGRVAFNGTDLLDLPTHQRYRHGLAYVPEARSIVPGLTVRENLRLGLLASPNLKREAEIIERTAETFPRLKERLNQIGESLSGGEQQMLAIARALAADPKMILLDEPSEGIMPVLVDEMFELFQKLRAEGMTILLVEQSVDRALAISDRAYIMDQGVIVHESGAAELLADEEMQERYCSV